MNKIYWIGTKESEIRTCKHLFDGSITFIGSGINGNISFSSNNDYIINYNEESDELNEFMENAMLKVIAENSDVSFFCYTTSYIFSFENLEINKHIICGNERSTLQLLRNKMDTRMWLGRYVPILPTIILSGSECSYSNLCNLFSDMTAFTIQGRTGAGGIDTFVMKTENQELLYQNFYSNHLYLVSPFMQESYSTNVHVIFDEKKFIILPGSVQIVEYNNNKLIYHGSDFILYQQLPRHILNEILKYARIICEKIQYTKYRGILGIDFLISQNQVFFLEINPRFQSSTSILNLALLDHQYPSIQEMILDIFLGKEIENPDKLETLQVFYSNYIVDYESEEFDYSAYIDTISQSDEIVEILWDGYSAQLKCQPGASIFSFTLSANISSIGSNGNLLVSDNIHPYKFLSYYQQFSNYVKWLKTALMNQGIRFSARLSSETKNFQYGVYSSIDLYLADEFVINCPISIPFHTLSPFWVDIENGNLKLYYGSTYVSDVKIADKAKYNSKTTANKIPYKAISFVATDRIRLHHSPICTFQKNNLGCQFCDVPGKGTFFSMEDIEEVINWQLHNTSFRHILIGGASGLYPNEQKNILEIVKHIRNISDKSIYVMSLPPENLSVLDDYFAAGVNEIAFNIEIYNRKIAKKIMPGKGKIPLNTYKKALLHSVELWGDKGNVKSLLVYGLEPDCTFLDGIGWLAAHGIQPVISPLRPLKGTLFENRIPPSTEQLMAIYVKAECICKKYHLSLGPSCVYCQNNTLSFNEQILDNFRNQN